MEGGEVPTFEHRETIEIWFIVINVGSWLCYAIFFFQNLRWELGLRNHIYLRLYKVRWMGLAWLVFLNRTLVFCWCVVQGGSKSKHHKGTCFKEIGLPLRVLIPALQLIVNMIGGTYVWIPKINKHALLIIIVNSREVILFEPVFGDVSSKICLGGHS